MSLNPWQWAPGTAPTVQQVGAVAGGPMRLERLVPDRIRAAAAAIVPSFAPKELEVLQFRGEPILMAYRPPSAQEASRSINIDLRAYLSPQLRLEHRLVRVDAPERGAEGVPAHQRLSGLFTAQRFCRLTATTQVIY